MRAPRSRAPGPLPATAAPAYKAHSEAAAPGAGCREPLESNPRVAERQQRGGLKQLLKRSNPVLLALALFVFTLLAGTHFYWGPTPALSVAADSGSAQAKAAGE